MTYNTGIYRKQGGNHLMLATAGRILDEGGLASGPGHSPLIWSDCPIYQMALNPALGMYFHDDFHSVQTTGFPYAKVGTTGTYLALAAQMQGVARLTSTASDNKDVIIVSGNNLVGMIDADHIYPWWFEARVRLSQIAAEQGVFVGLGEEAAAISTDFFTTDTMELKILDHIGFKIVVATAGAAVWQTEHSLAGGALAVVAAAAAAGSTSWVKLGMKSVPNAALTVSTVTYFVDGLPLAASVLSSATNFPLHQVMCLVAGIRTGSAAASALDIDWWSAAQLR
jgi:hypothetical protein